MRFAPCVGILALVAPSVAAAIPTTIGHQGRLFDAVGDPLEGQESVTFSLWDAASGGQMLWEEQQDLVFSDGYFQVTLGDDAPLEDTVVGTDTLYLGVQVGSTPPMVERLRVHAVPYAIVAGGVSGGVVDTTELRINGAVVIGSDGQLVAGLPDDVLDGDDDALGALSCGADQLAVFDGAEWVCGDRLVDHTHDAADIDSGTLSVDRLPVGTSSGTIAAGDHAHSFGQITGQLADSQLPSAFGSLVDTAVADGPINLAAGSTLNGQPIAAGTVYTDDMARAAMGSKANTNAYYHDRYGNPEAVAAMGSKANTNALNHDRYTDAEAVTAFNNELVRIGRTDSRVSFAGAWIDHPGWGGNRFAPNAARYTSCEGLNDCSAAYVELRLDSNTWGSVYLSHLDWSNTRTLGVYVSYDNGANYALHKMIDTYRPDTDSSPHHSANRLLISNLPQGNNVRVRVVAHEGRMHFEGFGLTKLVLPDSDAQPFRHVNWVTGRGGDGTCDVNGACGPSPLGARRVDIIKAQPNTALRIQYTDVMRSYADGNNARSCRWHIFIDGRACPSGSIHADNYAWYYENSHRARPLVGYCTGIPAGRHTVQVYVSNSPSYEARCHTGWQDSTFVLEVEEVR